MNNMKKNTIASNNSSGDNGVALIVRPPGKSSKLMNSILRHLHC